PIVRPGFPTCQRPGVWDNRLGGSEPHLPHEAPGGQGPVGGMNTTPASLLEQLRQPDASPAWRRFVDLYTPLLHYWARRLGLQPADAAALVQDVLLLLVRKLPGFTYDPRRSFRSWLHTVLLNVWRTRWRAHAGVPAAGDGALAGLTVADDSEALGEAEFRR